MRYEWAKGDVLVAIQPGAPGAPQEIGRATREMWRERATLQIGGATYTFTRRGWRSTVIAEREEERVMSAEQTGFWRRSWSVHTSEGDFELRPGGVWGTRLTVLSQGVEIGQLLRAGSWKNRAALETAGTMEPAVVAFLLWIAHVHWQRAAAAASS